MNSQMIFKIASLVKLSSADTADENRIQSMSEFVNYFAFDASNAIDYDFDSSCLGLMIKLDKFKVRLDSAI
jgi:hypothetical protein